MVLPVASDTDPTLPWREVRPCPQAALKPCLGGRGGGKEQGLCRQEMHNEPFAEVCEVHKSGSARFSSPAVKQLGAGFVIRTPEALADDSPEGRQM